MTRPATSGDTAEKLVNELAALETPEQRREFVAAHPALQDSAVLVAVTTRVLRQIRISAEEALGLSEAALAISEAIGTPEALAEGLRSKANALYGKGQNAAAAELHSKAIDLFERAGNQHEVARTLRSIALE